MELEVHEEFTEWAKERGVEINGICAHQFDGRGLGIIADRKIEPNTIILTVPLAALRTAYTVPKPISKAVGKITVHGLLAAHLVLDTSTIFAPYRAVLPSYASFEESVPLCFPKPLQPLLPAAATTLLQNQKRKLELDWSSVSSAFPDMKYDNYLHAWLLVNTRTFYFTLPRGRIPSNRDDCMAMSPFQDYFNHSSPNHPNCCSVSYTSTAYTVTSPSSLINKGEEIYISYGNHSNDFLLAEYGFILPDNEYDEVVLDDYVLPLLSASQKESLKEAGFLGNYILDNQTVCHRTQVALRILCSPIGKWRRFVDGLDGGEKEQKAVDELLAEKVFKKFKNDVEKRIITVGKSNEGLNSQREVICKRWQQIGELLDSAISRIKS